MSDYRFPKIAGSVRHDGAVVRLNHGQVWPADDPFVVARPELFSAEPHELTRSPQPRPARVPAPTAKKRPRSKSD